MERYDSYKDSGVEWIGEIPKNWGVNRVGNVFVQRKETVSDRDFPALSVTKRGIVPQLDNVAKTSHNDNRKLVLKGDFVINSRSDRKGSSGTSDFDGSVSVINMILKPQGIHGKYSHYLFRSYEFKEEFFRFGKGIVWDLWSTRFSEMKGIIIPIPPLQEQEQIAEYLDSKTALIDSLIEKTARKIELLKEKRTSLINEVVIKGLNPNVEMKDSGVEWIGEIPNHWRVTKVKYNFTFRGGSTPSTEVNEYWNGDIPWVSSKDVKTKFIYDTEDHVTSLGVQNSSCSIVPPDSLIVVVRSGILQRTIPMSINKVELVVNQDQKVMIPRGQTTVSWFYYFVKGNENRLLKNWVKEGTTVESIEVDYLSNHSFGLPPLHEQENIVEYLDEQTYIIDSTISTEEKRIGLLKEYRQSLISEVVTGKVKVTRNE